MSTQVAALSFSFYTADEVRHTKVEGPRGAPWMRLCSTTPSSAVWSFSSAFRLAAEWYHLLCRQWFSAAEKRLTAQNYTAAELWSSGCLW